MNTETGVTDLRAAAQPAMGAAALRAAAADLMFSDAPAAIQKFRDCNGWAYSFDLIQVRACVPEVNAQGDVEGGEYGEEILNYELCGPRGLIEAVVIELDRVCAALDEFRYQPPADDGTETAPADDATATEAPSPTEATATDAPPGADGAAPTSAEGDAAVKERAGAASDEDDAEFERQVKLSAAREFPGAAVPLVLGLCLPGGDSLLDLALLVLPDERHELLRDLRAVAAKWMERYGAAVKTERVG